jgi:N6-adenosine-specific RNA methylase IME4/ParB-like chromosome segregation protein Spo0J
MPIADIRVGERHRKDMGNLDELAAQLAKDGLHQAIGVTPDGTLIWGERRLRAAKLLGWTHIEAKTVDIEPIHGEYAENTFRKDYTLSEAVAIKRALEPLEKAAAKERQLVGRGEGDSGGRGKKKPMGNLPQGFGGRAADKAARVTGKARRTLEKAEAVVTAAEAEPERFGKLREQMDDTGQVNGVYRRLKVIQQAERIRAEPPPLPGNGPYRVVVIDFPWPYEPQQDDPSQRAARPYPTMNIEQICDFARRLSPLLHADSIVWLWCTNFHLIRYAAPVLDALGVRERTILTWVKDRFGTGDWLRSLSEHCILAVRGHPTVTLGSESTVLNAPASGHSVKPTEFYRLVERLCPAPSYLDVFSRYRHSEKWDCYGDEAPLPPGARVGTESPLKTPPATATGDQIPLGAGADDDLSIPTFLRRAPP